MGPVRIFPDLVEVRDEAGEENEIEVAASRNLISDADIAAFRVAGFRRRHGGPLWQAAARISPDAAAAPILCGPGPAKRGLGPSIVRPSRRPLRGLLRMTVRSCCDIIRHPEERPEG